MFYPETLLFISISRCLGRKKQSLNKNLMIMADHGDDFKKGMIIPAGTVINTVRGNK